MQISASYYCADCRKPAIEHAASLGRLMVAAHTGGRYLTEVSLRESSGQAYHLLSGLSTHFLWPTTDKVPSIRSFRCALEAGIG